MTKKWLVALALVLAPLAVQGAGQVDFNRFVREMVAAAPAQASARWNVVDKWTRDIQQRAARASIPASGRVLSKGISGQRSITNSTVVADGDVSVGYVKYAVVFTTGNLHATYIKDSIIVAAGDVKVTGYIKDSIILPHKWVRADGYLKDCVVQAMGVEAASYTKNNTYFNTPSALTSHSWDDAYRTSTNGPRDLFRFTN